MNNERLKEIRSTMIAKEVLPELYKKLPYKTFVAEGKRVTVRTIVDGLRIRHFIVKPNYWYTGYHHEMNKRLRKKKKGTPKGTTVDVYWAENIKEMCRRQPELLVDHIKATFPEKYNLLMKKTKIESRAAKQLQAERKAEDEDITEQALLAFEHTYDMEDVVQEVVAACVNQKLFPFEPGPFNMKKCSFPIVLNGIPKDNLFAKLLDPDEDWYDLEINPKRLLTTFVELGIDKQKLAASLFASTNPTTRLFAAQITPSPAMALLDPDEVVRRFAEVRLGRVKIPKAISKRAAKLFAEDFLVKEQQK